MNFNERQQKAIKFDGKHLLVLAGAGTGKTRTIVGRAAHLIHNGIEAQQIQILTFTKKAANEIVERVKAKMESTGSHPPNGSTFHSWCNQLISRFPNLFGASRYTVIDPDDQLGLMKICCGEHSDVLSKVRLKPQQILDIFSYGRNTVSNLSESIRMVIFKGKKSNSIDEEIIVLRPALELVIKSYQALKQKGKYLDYDDLLIVVSNRLRKDIKAREIIGNSYSHILIDEMQDTNPLQWTLVEPLSEICCLFCVGDDAQSIYSFRGADFNNVHLFKERLKDAEVTVLDLNYRSSQNILDLANWLLKKSPIQYDKILYSKIESQFKPKIVNIINQFEEANLIANNILESIGQEGLNFSDFLILSRSQHYTKPLQAVFIQKKIPFETFGGRKFTEAAHLKDIVSVYRIVNNPLDQIAWMRILTFVQGVGEVKAKKAIENITVNSKSDLTPVELKKILYAPEFRKVIDYYTSVYKNRDNLSKSIEALYHEIEFDLALKYAKDWVEKRKSDLPVFKLIVENYANIGEFVTEITLDSHPGTNSNVTLQGSNIQSTDINDKVVISTVHSAKGLEADTCFVLNVSPMIYPSSHNLDNVDLIEEDRRILYVAITRAKRKLYITRYSSSINAKIISGESIKDNHSSAYFLENIPDELISQTSATANLYMGNKDIDSPNEIDLDMGFDFN